MSGDEDLRGRFRTRFSDLAAKERGAAENRSKHSAACCAAGEDVVILSVFRSPLFSTDGQEDILKVELPRALEVASVRQKIAEMYGIPEASQRLQLTPELGGKRLWNSTPVATLVHKPIFLLPADIEAEADDADDVDSNDQFVSCDGSDEEQAALARGLVESLRGVDYKVRIQLPEDVARGSKSGVQTLTLDALAPVGNIIGMFEAQLTDGAGKCPMLLVLLNGQALPPHVPLHFAGIRDGSTVALVTCPNFDMDPRCRDVEDDSDDDDPILNWASKP
jgi:hypothetical protein